MMLIMEKNNSADNHILNQMIKPLLTWYDRGRRILPWREEPTPYHVWISEIMLQQTRVEAVKPYYDRFIGELPDIFTLAYTREEKLLKLWEGLGYYNRVRNIQKAALMIMEQYKGQMPDEYEDLLKLPGIGSYTAGAIASIAYGKAVPAVDGNVLRVLARLKLDDRDIAELRVKKDVERYLKEVIPAERPGDFNQALMELGAVVCIPRGLPKCSECPWESICAAHKGGREEEFPVKSKKKPRVIQDKTILVIRDEHKAALRKREDKGLLAGMYEFPSFEGRLSPEEVLQELKRINLKVISIKSLPESKHIFTHREWHMIGYVIRVDELEMNDNEINQNFIFADVQTAQENYPIPTAFQTYTRYLNIKQGTDHMDIPARRIKK